MSQTGGELMSESPSVSAALVALPTERMARALPSDQ